MSFRYVFILAAGTALCPSALAQSADEPPAQQKGEWYFATSIGAIDSLNYDYAGVEFPGLFKNDFSAVSEVGLTLEEGVGYAFASGFRFEATAFLGHFGGAKTNGVATFAPGGLNAPDIIEFSVKGKQVQIAALNVNGYYDFARSGSLRPYVGVGAGLASVEFEDGVIDAEDTALNLQAMGGISIKVSSSASLFVEARWQSLPDIGVKAVDVAAGLPLNVKFDLSEGSVRSGLRLAF